MTDLETELREALHSRTDGLSAADLRHAGGPRACVLDRRRVLLPLAAAAAVVALGSGAAIWAGHGSNDGPATTGTHSVQTGVRGGAALLDTQWRLESVTISGRTVQIPAGLRAYVAFERGRTLLANDGVNTYSGRYRSKDDGIVISDVAGTQVGYVGVDPAVRAAASGIDALHGSVLVVVNGPRLTLRAGDTTVVAAFAPGVRADPDPGFTGHSADPSPTPSSSAA